MESAVNTDIPRVALWSCPRSLSTAFERAVLELGNIEVFNEEFTTAFYFGPQGVRLCLAPNHTFQWVKDLVEADYPGRDAVFIKDFPYPLVDRREMIPDGFFHTFLVRDPSKVFPSLKQRYETATVGKHFAGTDIKKLIPIEGYTYKEIRDFHCYIKSRGLPTIVIDADDLLEDPVQMFRQYCQITGLPFKESMVKWEPVRFTEVDWHCSRVLRFMNYLMGWYEGALKSSGFQKPKPRHVDMDSFTPDTKLAIEASQPYYDELYAQRMTLNYSPN